MSKQRTTRQRVMRAYKENSLLSESPLYVVGLYLAEGTSVSDALKTQAKERDFHDKVLSLLRKIYLEEKKMNKLNKLK